jgi:hypothetical protein
MDASVYYIWILWIIAIPLGPPLGWLFQKHWAHLDRVLRYTMLAFFVASVMVGLCTIFTSWSFRGFWTQAVNLALAYISATSLVCIAFKKSTGGFSLYAARGSVVIVALLVYSGLVFTYLRTDVPDTETRLGDRLVLRRCSGGWAGIDWEGVAIVQQPAQLPFLEKRLYSIHIGVTEDCDATSVHVEPDLTLHEIRVQCGRQKPYIFARVKMP